jgi:uncharacterized protein (DUF2384 family)
MQFVYYFSSALNAFCKSNCNCDVRDWVATLSYDDLCNLKTQIEAFVSPLPTRMSSTEGIDSNYLAFAAESQKRRKRVCKLSWEKRERVLLEISQYIILEIDARRLRIKALEADAKIVFGSAAKARKWMTQNNTALCGSPISMLNTKNGAEEVRKALASIAYGGAI